MAGSRHDRAAGGDVDGLGVAEAARRHRLPAWLLPGLIALEHARVGRFGPGGINAQVTELLESAAGGATAPDGVAAGGLRTPAGKGQTQLVSLELSWFRQFAAARIEFQRDPGRPISVIEARNGYGKSHLVEALRFAMVEDRRSDLSELRHLYIDDGVDEVTTAVVVEVDSATDGRVRVRKAVSFRRRPGGSWGSPSPPVLTVEAASLEQAVQDRRAEEWLAERFPPEVLDYFIFDAESAVVQKLSGQRGERLPDVRAQVEAAVGVQPLARMAKRCKAAGRRWAESAGGGGEGDSSDVHRADAERAVAAAEQLGAKIGEAERSVEALREILRRVGDDLQALGGEGTAASTDDLRGERDRAQVRLDHHRGVFRRSLEEVLPLALVAGSAEQRDRGSRAEAPWLDHPEAARAGAVAIARAVAARQFSWAQGGSAAEIEAELVAFLGLEGGDGQGAVRELRRRAEVARGQLPGEESLEALTALPAVIEGLEAKLATCSERRRDRAWREQYDDLIRTREETRGQIEAMERDLAAWRGRREGLQGQAEEAQRAARDGAKDERRRQRLLVKADVAARAGAALEEVAAAVLGQRIGVMERAASDKLRDIAHKRDLYDRIVIDRDTLRYRILDRQGEPVPPDRSTGERMVLALALVHGLRQASGLQFPLFVEAPLKGLDAMHQDRVIRQFLLEYRGQTILLVKPGEFPESAAHLVREQVGERFCISRPIEGRDVSRIDRGDPSLVAVTQ